MCEYEWVLHVITVSLGHVYRTQDPIEMCHIEARAKRVGSLCLGLKNAIIGSRSKNLLTYSKK